MTRLVSRGGVTKRVRKKASGVHFRGGVRYISRECDTNLNMKSVDTKFSLLTWLNWVKTRGNLRGNNKHF